MRFITVLAATAASAYSADICRAVVFSSGDQTASYQAGVLKALAASGADRVAYNAMTGVSGGAVSAGILSSFAEGQESDAADRIKQFWIDAANSPLYKDWFGGVGEGLLLKGGLYNNKQLLEFLDTELADIGSPVRNVNVGLADVLTGKWMDFNLSTNFMDVMKGSFAYAGFFEPYKAMDTEWFDGSSIWDVDAFSAINKCLETHTPANIKVDVILTSEKELKVVDPSNFKTIEMGWRFLHVSRYYKQMDGLLRAQFAYPEVEWCVISPTTALDDGRLPLNFNEATINTMFSQGEADGTAAVTGCAQTTEDHIQMHALKKKRDARVKGLDFATFQSKKAAGEFEEYSLNRQVNTKSVVKEFLQ